MTARRIGRDQILQSARDLFLEEGFARLTMRRLGDRLGVSAPAVYRHYRDKDELLGELVDQANTTLGEYLAKASRAATPAGRLRATAGQYARFAVEQPEYYGILFLAAGRPKMDILPREHRSANFAVLLSRVRECLERQQLPSGDPVVIAISLWAQWHGLVTMYRAGRFGPELKRFLRLFARSADWVLEAGAGNLRRKSR